MNILFVFVAIAAVILLFVGGFVVALKWLLWIGVILALIAIIGWLFRAVAGRRRV